MKIKDPKATALIFQNGKIVYLGLKMNNRQNWPAENLQKSSKIFVIQCSIKNFKIQNIV